MTDRIPTPEELEPLADLVLADAPRALARLSYDSRELTFLLKQEPLRVAAVLQRGIHDTDRAPARARISRAMFALGNAYRLHELDVAFAARHADAALIFDDYQRLFARVLKGWRVAVAEGRVCRRYGREPGQCEHACLADRPPGFALFCQWCGFASRDGDMRERCPGCRSKSSPVSRARALELGLSAVAKEQHGQAKTAA